MRNLEQEPFVALDIIENPLQAVTGSAVAILIAYLDGIAYILRDMRVIIYQATDHLASWNELIVVVLNGLQLADVTDTADSCAADTTYTLSHYIDRIKEHIGLLIEEQVIVAEM